MNNGFFLTFEGSEGCGKSTQIRLLVEYCEKAGISFLLTREPGGTDAGEAIRNLLQHSKEGDKLCSEAELLLFAASRAQLVREVIMPALEAGQLVVSDRFLDSTTVYQGVARRLAPEQVRTINEFAIGSCRPDLTIVLDMDSARAMQRVRTGRQAVRDRMEEQPAAFYEAVRAGYLALAQSEPDRIFVVDATLPPTEISALIIARLTKFSHGLLEGICS